MDGLRLVYEEPADDDDINYCCMYGLRLVYEEPSDDEDINYCCMYGLRLVYKLDIYRYNDFISQNIYKST